MVRKAVLSNRIYLDNLTEEEVEYLRETLKYTIYTRAGTKTLTEVIENFQRVTKTISSIPIGRLDLVPNDYLIVDKRSLVPIDFPAFHGKLRESQQEIYDNLTDSCMINAPVSYGKTFTALAIANKLGQKTLVITHTTMLRDQWIAEIDKVFGIEAGKVGSGDFNIKPDIVVANVQTATKRMPELSDKFGTLILDEMHHLAASTFTSILDKSKARYKIGLSGTLVRKDGKHVVFNDYFGFTVFKPEKENCMLPQVVIVDTNITLPPRAHWAHRINELELNSQEYRNLVVDLASNAASKGYKVLVVGSRVEFLKWCSDNTPRASIITGELKSIEERTRVLNLISTGEIDVLYGTMSIFSEGISQNDLSCIILATPINNESLLTQLIGRIIREVPDKKQPLVIDINLKGNTAKNQANGRLGHYVQSGYTVRILKK